MRSWVIRFSSHLAVLTFLLLVPSRPAMAGACCVASSGVVPTRLDTCERWLLGVGLSGETAMGSWDSGGKVQISSLEENALVSTLGAAWRWGASGQLLLHLPTRLNWKGAGGTEAWGGGVGDLRLEMLLGPFAIPTERFLPKVYLSLGARLPTGRTWEESSSPLLADVTGIPGGSVTTGITLEETGHPYPWSLGMSAELPLAEQGTPLVAATASLGRYLGTRWTAVASLRYSVVPPNPDVHRPWATRTTAGLRLIRAHRLAWRAWLGVDLDVPLAGLGHSNTRSVMFGAGMLIVR